MLVQKIALQFVRDEQGWYKFGKTAAKHPSEVRTQAGLEWHGDGGTFQQKLPLFVIQLLVPAHHAGIEFFGCLQNYPERVRLGINSMQAVEHALGISELGFQDDSSSVFHE